MTKVFPGPYNTYVPSHEASGKMVIDYARNINKFGVNKYTQIIPSEKMTGQYLEMTIEEAGRIQYTDLRNFKWPDRMEAPQGVEETESSEFKEYRCERYAYPAMLGDLTIEQASWDVLEQHASIKSRQAMTGRTQLAINVFTNTGNYDASHVLDVGAGGDISGNAGNWAQSTTARQDIKRSLQFGAERILDDTLAAVEIDDLVVTINSDLAAQLSQCQEIVDFIKGSPEALAEVRGEKPGENVIYGLPNKLYGFPLVVEKTRKVTSAKGATRSVSDILPTATPFMAARPGGLVGIADAPNFSTVVCYALEEMTVESLKDKDNRRVKLRVVENLVYIMVAPASGILFQNVATAS